MDYAVTVYKFAASLPEQEKYNLASQLRRAVTSAPLNIAEGCGHQAIRNSAAFLAADKRFKGGRQVCREPILSQ